MSRHLDFVYHVTNGRNHGPVLKTQSLLLNGIYTVILWQDYYGKGKLRKFYWNTLGKKFQTGTVICQSRQEDYSYPCMWTISNWHPRQKTWNRLGEFSWKTLTWENQHHFLTMYIWIALKESVKSARTLWRTTEVCSNPGFLLEPRKNYRPELQGNLMQKQYLLGPMTWKVTQRNVWKDIANLQIKRPQQLYKVATPCMKDHQFNEEENKSVGELSTVCSQNVLKCLYLARIGRPDILWSVNKLARAITK